jgi:hypothetical protein
VDLKRGGEGNVQREKGEGHKESLVEKAKHILNPRHGDGKEKGSPAA